MYSFTDLLVIRMQISFGEMIGCDNTNCPIEWFHFQCVQLITKPKGQYIICDVSCGTKFNLNSCMEQANGTVPSAEGTGVIYREYNENNHCNPRIICKTCLFSKIYFILNLVMIMSSIQSFL